MFAIGKIKFGKDRGKEPERKKEDFRLFWTWDEKTDDFAGSAEFDGVTGMIRTTRSN